MIINYKNKYNLKNTLTNSEIVKFVLVNFNNFNLQTIINYF